MRHRPILALEDGSLESALAKVQCVTYPRSGHHLLVNMLMRYFARDLEWPLTDGSRTWQQCREVLCAGPLYYCEMYNHCQTSPCTDANTNLQKHHDRSLDLPYDPSRRYIVQVRHPLESLASLYEMQLAGERAAGDAVEDSAKAWRRFLGPRLRRKKLFRKIRRGQAPLADLRGLLPGMRRARLPNALEQWRRFIRKWVPVSLPAPTLHVRYGDLVESPTETCMQAIRFLAPGATIDTEFVTLVVRSLEISRRRPLQAFRHYDANQFRSFERALQPEMRAAGLEAIC